MTETVYVASRAWTGGAKKYHCDPECSHVKGKVREKRLSLLFDDAEPCQYCHGTHEVPEPSWDHYRALKKAANAE